MITSKLIKFSLLPLVLLAGCRRAPQIPPDSRQLIGSLRTAVSARRKDWLETNAKIVEDKHLHDRLTDEQYQEFQTIIADGREGNWREAEAEVVRLAKDQVSR